MPRGKQPPSLTISQREAARYLGLRGTEPDRFTQALIEEGRELLLQRIRPKALWEEFPLREGKDILEVAGTQLQLPGRDIQKHLKGCERVILLAATLSLEADRLIRQAQVADMAKGVVLDCCATAAVEALCDWAEEEMVLDLEARGLFLTTRFSPGYGDLPLQLQKDFLQLLDAPRQIGLCATESFMLTPRKSVTAVLGVSRIPREKNKSCMSCAQKEHCAYRREGEHCGF